MRIKEVKQLSQGQAASKYWSGIWTQGWPFPKLMFLIIIGMCCLQQPGLIKCVHPESYNKWKSTSVVIVIKIIIIVFSVLNLLKRTFKMLPVHNDRACTLLFSETLIRTADVSHFWTLQGCWVSSHFSHSHGTSNFTRLINSGVVPTAKAVPPGDRQAPPYPGVSDLKFPSSLTWVITSPSQVLFPLKAAAKRKPLICLEMRGL